MLQTLPSTYEDTNKLLTLFETGADEGTFIMNDLYVRNNKSFLKSVWNIDFVKDFLTSDDMFAVFLEDTWKDFSSNYIKFYQNEHGTTSSTYNLPHSEPAGTEYYDLQNLEYVWLDENSNNIGKAFKFTVTDFDIVRVYCYKNEETYTLYRQ